MIMHIKYSEGYFDALRDVYSWFDNHAYIFDSIRISPKRKIELVKAILFHFMNNRDSFFMEKECYEFELSIPKNKKERISIKQYIKDGNSTK